MSDFSKIITAVMGLDVSIRRDLFVGLLGGTIRPSDLEKADSTQHLLRILEEVACLKQFRTEVNQSVMRMTLLGISPPPDESIDVVASLFVNCFAKEIYDRSELSTSEQVKALSAIKVEKAKESKQDEYRDQEEYPGECKEHIVEFTSLHSVLMSSEEASDERKSLFERKIKFLLDREIKVIAPIIKKIRFLENYKNNIDQTTWNNKGWQWCPFWKGKAPDGIARSRKTCHKLNTKSYDLTDFKPEAIETAFTEVSTMLAEKETSKCMRKKEVSTLYLNSRTKVRAIVNVQKPDEEEKKAAISPR